MPASLSHLTYPEQLEAAWSLHLAPRSADAPTVISTFAGGGGSSLGYSFAGYHERLAVEFDGHAADTLRTNFPGLDVFQGDITTLTARDVLRRTGLGPRELAVFDGSPPCQGFSLVGKRQFTDTRNQLFREYVRLLKGLQPQGFVLENVRGLVVGKMRLIFAEMLQDLKACGYVVRAWVLNARHYGVPQSRPRLMVLGVRTDLNIERLVAPTPHHVRPQLVQHALAGVPDQAWRSLTPVNRRIWKKAGLGEKGCDLRLHWDNAKSSSHFTHVKLNPYRPCPTITKSGSPNYLHWREPRSLNIAEAKRLCSFPDEFQLSGSFAEQWGRLGNSVPPFLMWSVAAHMRRVLEV